MGTAASLPLLRRREVAARGSGGTDPLTGLANHRGFHQVLDRPARAGSAPRPRLALVMLDLDNFKAVNDAPRTSLRRRGAEVDRQGAPDRGRADGHRRPDGRRGVRADRPGPKRRRPPTSAAERARDAVARSRFAASTSPARRGSRRSPTTPRTRRPCCQLAEGALYWAKRRGKGRTRRFDPGARAARLDQAPRAPRSPSCSTAPARSPRSSSPWWPSRAGTWSATRRCRGSRARRSARPRRGSRRRTAAASGPTSRPPRSGPPSSRSAGRSGPTSRSTSARRR